jgi:hypothetical protein
MLPGAGGGLRLGYPGREPPEQVAGTAAVSALSCRARYMSAGVGPVPNGGLPLVGAVTPTASTVPGSK